MFHPSVSDGYDGGPTSNKKTDQSKENEGKRAGVWKAFKQIQLLCLKPFEGMEEMQKDWRTVYKISTNAISELSTIQSGERGEVERLRGLITKAWNDATFTATSLLLKGVGKTFNEFKKENDL